MNSLYKKKPFPYLIIVVLTIISSLLLWLPFLAHISHIGGINIPTTGMQTIEANWDGPLYIIPAKTLYNPNDSIYINPPLGLSPSYFAAHLPLYPFTIRMLSSVLSYPKAMLASTLIASILFFCLFYYVSKKHRLTSFPLILTLVLMFWPRLWIIRSIGSPEPFFLVFLLASIFLFIDKKYFFASILGSLAVWTKVPGVLLFPSFGLYIGYIYFKTKTFKPSYLWILLIPLSLIGVFQFYSIQLHDFFAYFHTGAVVPMPRIFAVFNTSSIWVGTAWLEDIIFLFLFLISATVVAVTCKIKENDSWIKIIASFMVVFIGALTFVEHRDISRYSLPLIPLVFLIFEKLFTDRRFLIALCIVLPALYLYALNFIIANAAPITDWIPFL